MKHASKIAMAALLAAGAMTMTAKPASAYIACNGEGECWHVHHRYAYHPEFGVVVHPDRWRWRHEENYRWREHPGRGYWRGGVWIPF
jgi:hypothetical protein